MIVFNKNISKIIFTVTLSLYIILQRHNWKIRTEVRKCIVSALSFQDPWI
jgi:hypothetical protein